MNKRLLLTMFVISIQARNYHIIPYAGIKNKLVFILSSSK
ncbi:hypothetical protein EST35_0434 [Pseudomonas phage vB_PaeM_PA5oct]|uniref:Uncharacterized protein n=1 Tax=Pseudomonas phage vB_PaeM_PA5oct TaxID=2163605 RepID=A0A4Y5JWI6_9CAUD|nr:hypothetical protein PQE65_gp063 [Pseudomonas phage vB_PaeM_PA5oct]QCG76302.1 hypothetical protein EST35_0434 [Pseudomonas phage vB_PaeM_PA5oct]